ncbi:MAG: DNRLRE domain-containing protein [Lachnospiraceae bacterium]
MKKGKVWAAMALLCVCLLSAGRTPRTAEGTTGSAAGTESEETNEPTEAAQFMDCFEPMPIIGGLSSDCWGAAEVGARDQLNGLEDANMSDYSYWDGGIIKDEITGTYYLFASRWNQAGGHWGQDGIDGWQGSQAVYATSDSLCGPYTDRGLLWPDWCDGAGHNVFPFTISKSDLLYADGYRYAISISDTGMHGETANGTLHISKSLDGPWELVENGNNGKLKATGGSGFSLSNISIMVRPDGRYEATNRNGDLALADSLSGTWEVVENSLWKKIDGMSSDNIEDPVLWYSDGLYHIVVNKWDARMAYYLTSEDGITGWVRHPGTAYTPDADFLRYTDGTVNNWEKIERPNIYVEDGKIAAMTFAVIDVAKEADYGNDQHGSKIIVVPFSSEKLTAFDRLPDPLAGRSGIPATADTTAQTWDSEVKKNYGAEPYIQLQKDPNYQNHGMGLLGEGTRPDEWYDNKIGYLNFDLSELGTLTFSEKERICLSLVYLNKPSGDASATRIQVTLSDTTWKEGSGRESVNRNRASAGTLTWENQPSLHYDSNDLEHTTALSEEFDTADVETEVLIDVTELVKRFVEEHPEETTIGFAMNVTVTGTRIRVGSKEAGNSFAPKLTVNIIENEAAPTEAPTAVPTAAPTEAPTKAPTTAPTAVPTDTPDAVPTAAENSQTPTVPVSAEAAEEGGSSAPVVITVLIVLVIGLVVLGIVLARKAKK